MKRHYIISGVLRGIFLLLVLCFVPRLWVEILYWWREAFAFATQALNAPSVVAAAQPAKDFGVILGVSLVMAFVLGMLLMLAWLLTHPDLLEASDTPSALYPIPQPPPRPTFGRSLPPAAPPTRNC